MRQPAAPGRLLTGVGMAIALTACSGGQALAQAAHEHAADEHFGSVHFDTSCSAAVQPQFDRAVAMVHSFFYPETEKAFRAIAERESACAMAYWGVAISVRPNPLTAPFLPANLKRGWEAIQQARGATTATTRERDWIEALAPFFDGYETVDQRTRSRRYARAMTALHERYPQDSEAAVFSALALLEAVDLTDTTYADQLKAAAILEPLRVLQPDHPGIAHYLIHAYDYAPIAARGLPAARAYAQLAPSAPHALHMPSHIFSTLGMWQDAITTNLAADRANISYFSSTTPAFANNPAAITARYHALDFLTYAYLQLAQDSRAREILQQRDRLGQVPADGSVTVHTAFAAIPVRYAVERGACRRQRRFRRFARPTSRRRPSSGSAGSSAPPGAGIARRRGASCRNCRDSKRNWPRQAATLTGRSRSASSRPRQPHGSIWQTAGPARRWPAYRMPPVARTVLRSTWAWRIGCGRCASNSPSSCSRRAGPATP